MYGKINREPWSILQAGRRECLPNIRALEQAVDAELLMWPRGNFDSLTDMKADPTQIPVSFTWGNHPYGWTGNFMAGPFHGLTSQNNNVHALNSGSLLLADSSPVLFGIDKEVYLAILLQNAAAERFRLPANGNQKPSAFVASRHTTPGSLGVNQVVLPPTYPKGTLLSPDGTFTSAPGFRFWQQNNAMSAWQDTLFRHLCRCVLTHNCANLAGKCSFVPVAPRVGCPACHSGRFLSNNTVVSNDVIAANAARAMALRKTQFDFTQPLIFSFHTPVPLPPHPKVIAVPTINWIRSRSIWPGLTMAPQAATRCPAWWDCFGAPYLHDGGVAVEKNIDTEVRFARNGCKERGARFG
jgi:hypothetical protein